MIERMMNGSPGRASSQELIDRVEEDPFGNHRGYMVNIDPDDAFLEANRHNGVDLTLYFVDRRCEGIFNRVGWEEISWNLRDPTLDAFSQLRSGYKGGNIPNLLKSCNPCSRVNPKDVAKRRAKNKVTRKTKRK